MYECQVLGVTVGGNQHKRAGNVQAQTSFVVSTCLQYLSNDQSDLATWAIAKSEAKNTAWDWCVSLGSSSRYTFIGELHLLENESRWTIAPVWNAKADDYFCNELLRRCQ